MYRTTYTVTHTLGIVTIFVVTGVYNTIFENIVIVAVKVLRASLSRLYSYQCIMWKYVIYIMKILRLCSVIVFVCL